MKKNEANETVGDLLESNNDYQKKVRQIAKGYRGASYSISGSA